MYGASRYGNGTGYAHSYGSYSTSPYGSSHSLASSASGGLYGTTSSSLYSPSESLAPPLSPTLPPSYGLSTQSFNYGAGASGGTTPMCGSSSLPPMGYMSGYSSRSSSTSSLNLPDVCTIASKFLLFIFCGTCTVQHCRVRYR